MRKKGREIFKGNVFSVYAGERSLPDGRKMYVEQVRHPGASLIVPFRDGRIVLIRQFRPVIGKFIWEIPAGTLSDGESGAGCARRELLEETGYPAERLERMGYIYTTPGFCDEKILVFRAVCGRRQPVKRDPDEVMRVRSFTPAEIKKMFSGGKITDSKTIAALAIAGVI